MRHEKSQLESRCFYKKKDSQSRKWQLTINNPLEKDFTHEKIKQLISGIKPCIYYCLSDEIGGKEKTHHTHIFIACSSGVRFSTIKNKFPQAHIELAKGTCEQNRDYVFKLGKHEKSKGETKIKDTQEEYGEMPLERQGSRNDLADLYDMIKQGYSDIEILEENLDKIFKIDFFEKIRQAIRQNEQKNKIRDLTVTYIYGETGTGKTSSIMNEYGLENVYRVTSYEHGAFDGYKGQDVIVFEEFCSSFKINDMLNYLDCYPLELPCRYANKIACYTKVYIVSNVPLFYQYKDVQGQNFETWKAFLRRIQIVKEYYAYKLFNEYSIEEYIEKYSNNK